MQVTEEVQSGKKDNVSHWRQSGDTVYYANRGAVPRGRTSIWQVVHLARVQQVLKFPEHSAEKQQNRWKRLQTVDANHLHPADKTRYLSPCFPPLFGLTNTSRGWVPATGTIWQKNVWRRMVRVKMLSKGVILMAYCNLKNKIIVAHLNQIEIRPAGHGHQKWCLTGWRPPPTSKRETVTS